MLEEYLSGEEVLGWLKSNGSQYENIAPVQPLSGDAQRYAQDNVASYSDTHTEVTAITYTFVVWETDEEGQPAWPAQDKRHVTVSLELRVTSDSMLQDALLGIAMERTGQNSHKAAEARPLQPEAVVLTGASAVWAFARAASYTIDRGHQLYEALTGSSPVVNV